MNKCFSLENMYKVTHLLADLGWVELDFGSSLGATIATYCPSRLVEHPKFKSTEPSPPGDGSPCTVKIAYIVTVYKVT